MQDRFIRARMLLGEEAMDRLWHSHVCVLGVGGVGSWCAEALARSGVGHLTLVDEDTVSVSNTNRQLEALSSSIGRSKVDSLAERLCDISPGITVNARHMRYEAESADEFFDSEYDYIADAIDLVSCKVDLIVRAMDKKIPIISALGTGNKTDASQLRICDISKTSGCPLARVVRKELRGRGIIHHTVVFSPEAGLKAEQLEPPPPGRRSVPGSLVWVPASAGLLIAQHIVTELAEDSRGDKA